MHPQDLVSRRDALKTLGAGAALVGVGALSPNTALAQGGKGGTAQPFELPKLGYAYDALEPHIDAKTMEIHHSKHHQAYITNANNALKGQAALQGKTAEEILKNLSAAPEAVRTTLRNNVGGHVNHAHFWKVIGPKGGGAPKGDLGEAITKTFGSFDTFKTQFGAKATGQFGSGWAWLTLKDGKLDVVGTPNQDTPLSSGAMPLLGLDVWEHAYYLKYQNRRPDYITAFWNVVNWEQVAANYKAAK
ncbi:MAG: Fe-Mn family superoxide dismutase [Verrucomicrobiota bacterium]